MFLCFHLSIHLLRSDMLSFIGTYRYNWSVKELHKMLHWCNEQLQQFSHMNKKALDQHEVSDEALQKRQAELEASDEVLWYWILMLKYLLFYLLFLTWDYNCSFVSMKMIFLSFLMHEYSMYIYRSRINLNT